MKKTYKSALALALALSLLLSLDGAAFADMVFPDPIVVSGEEYAADNVFGLVVAQDLSVYDGLYNAYVTGEEFIPAENVTAEAGISAAYGQLQSSGIFTDKADAEISVTGDVSASGSTDASGIQAYNSSGVSTVIKVAGNVTAAAVGEGVNATGITATVAFSGGSIDITVTGDVSATAVGDGTLNGVYAYGEGSTVTVRGDVTAESEDCKDTGAVYASFGGAVSVEKNDENGGNVQSSGTGVIATSSGDTTTTVNVEGTVTAGDTGVFANAMGGSVAVTAGGLSVTGDTAVDAKVSNGGSVEIKADDGSNVVYVKANSGGVTAGGNIDKAVKVTFDGDVATNNEYYVGVSAGSGGTGDVTVIVDGDVTGAGTGIGVKADNAEVTVTGSVTEGLGVMATNGATVEVAGSVTGTGHDAVTATEGGEVLVGGDVTGAERGVYVELSSYTSEKSSVVVEGTLSETGDNAHVIALEVPGNVTMDSVKELLPEIVVQSIQSDADYVICTGSSEDQTNRDIAAAMRDGIKYIVKTEAKDEQGGDKENITIDLVNYQTKEAAETKTLHEGEEDERTLTVATTTTQLVVGVDKTKGTIVGVTVENAYDATENPYGNKVTHDETNDQWIITVGRGGNVTITATVGEAKQEENNNPKPWPFPGPWSRSEADTSSTGYTTVPEAKTFVIDMTGRTEQTFTTENMRSLRSGMGIEMVRILVNNGMFTISMNDLLTLVGGALEFTLKSEGDTLEISADGVVLTTLYLAA